MLYSSERGRGDGAFESEGAAISGGAGDRERVAPVPRQQRGEVGDLVVGDPGQHVGEPSLGIDFVELGRLNQRQHDRGALAAAIGTSGAMSLRRTAARASGAICHNSLKVGFIAISHLPGLF